MESQDLVWDIILFKVLEYCWKAGEKGGGVASGLKLVSTWHCVLALQPLSGPAINVLIGQSSACRHDNADPRQEIRGSMGKWPTMTRA